jgi:16S rRNA C967 or C1407 C5-methylase (RsmB/RsmF family)
MMTDQSVVARQEVVSILPVLFLDLHMNDRVLDMCAAPGSKSLQILEFFQVSQRGARKVREGSGKWEGTERWREKIWTNFRKEALAGVDHDTNECNGLLVANDLQKDRLKKLINRYEQKKNQQFKYQRNLILTQKNLIFSPFCVAPS